MGIAFTSWHYIWRTTPIRRRELSGTLEQDLPPALPALVSHDRLQQPEHGAGPLLHRTYSGVIRGADRTPEQLMEHIRSDPNWVAPGALARFQKVHGGEGHLAVGDEYLVRMPGPWDGPVRVVELTPRSFRFATLAGHLEAGQIEWRAQSTEEGLLFEIESWARSGDRLSALLHGQLRMAKEVQLHMWGWVVENVSRRLHGRLVSGIEIETRRVEQDAFDD